MITGKDLCKLACVLSCHTQDVRGERIFSCVEVIMSGNMSNCFENSQHRERTFFFEATQLTSCRSRDDKPGQLFQLGI